MDVSQVRIIDGTVQNPYREFTYTIGAGESQIVAYDHTTIRILSLTSGASLQMQFGQSGDRTSLIGAGMGFEYVDGEGQPLALRNVVLYNAGGSPLTVTVGMAIGKVSDNRLTVTGTLATLEVKAATLDSLADVAMNNGSATLLAAADSTRRELIVTNLLANAVSGRVGDSGVGAANGVELQAGDSITLTTTAAVYGFVGSASKNFAVTAVKD